MISLAHETWRTWATVVVVVVGVVQPGSVSAQWYGGFVAGPTFATVSGSLIEQADGAFGAVIGLDVGFPLPAQWLVDTELRWVQKGASNVPIGPDAFDFRYDFVEVVVTGNRSFPLAQTRWAVSPYAGLAVAFDFRCGFRLDGTSHYSTCAGTTPGGTLHTPELSIPFGVAFRHLYTGGSRLSLDLRYSVGGTKTLRSGGAVGRNRVLEVLFSFGVPFRGDT